MNLGEFINIFIVLKVLIKVFALLKKAGGVSNKMEAFFRINTVIKMFKFFSSLQFVQHSVGVSITITNV